MPRCVLEDAFYATLGSIMKLHALPVWFMTVRITLNTGVKCPGCMLTLHWSVLTNGHVGARQQIAF